MALVVKDRVQETTTTTGTGTITLAGAVTGFQSFSVIGNGNTTYYAIVGGSQWEVGLGTYTSSGTTLSRDTILESSTGGTAVDFNAGIKNVFCTYPAEKSLYLDASNNAIGLGTVAATTTLTNATGLPLSTGVTGTLPIANGGTGTTSTTFANLTTNVTGTLPVSNGGTGASTLTANNVILGNGTSAVQFVAPGTNGNVLTSNGTTWTSAASSGGGTGTPPLNSLYTSTTTTFTPNADSKFVVVYVTGGGGGAGGNSRDSAGAGGAGGTGQASSFGSLMSANGGNGGNAGNSNACQNGSAGNNGNGTSNTGVTTINIDTTGSNTSTGAIVYGSTINVSGTSTPYGTGGSNSYPFNCGESLNAYGGNGGRAGRIMGRIAKSTYGNSGISITAGAGGNGGNGAGGAPAGGTGTTGAVLITEFFG